jgi:transposase
VLARKLQASDHTVKIILVQFVKPYVKLNKNDMVDVAAIAEAVTRPSMQFVQIRQPEQSARQALPIVHTIRTGETGIQWGHETEEAAGHLAGKILATMSERWPESVRALMVHSAEWTPAMKQQFDEATAENQKRALLRKPTATALCSVRTTI